MSQYKPCSTAPDPIRSRPPRCHPRTPAPLTPPHLRTPRSPPLQPRATTAPLTPENDDSLETSSPRTRKHPMPSSAARSAQASSNELLPIPAGPSTDTNAPWPVRASASRPLSALSSPSRSSSSPPRGPPNTIATRSYVHLTRNGSSSRRDRVRRRRGGFTLPSAERSGFSIPPDPAAQAGARVRSMTSISARREQQFVAGDRAAEVLEVLRP